MSIAPEIEAVRAVGPLLLIADYARKLGIQEIVDRNCPCGDSSGLTHGHVVVAIVANRLCQPSAMPYLNDWARQSAAGPILGLDGALLDDERIASCLDALAPHLDQVQGEVMARAIREFGLDLRRVEWNLSSVDLEGVYLPDESSEANVWADAGSAGVAGFKHFRVGRLLTADGGVPLQFMHGDDHGAEVDDILTVLAAASRHISFPGSLVVGDSELLRADMLAKLREQRFAVLAPAPRTGEIRDAYSGLDPEAWIRLEYLPRRQERLPEDERTEYLGQETEFLFPDPEGSEELRLRRLFVRTETERAAHAARRSRSIDRYLEKLMALTSKIGQRGATTASQVERSLEKLRKEHALAAPFVMADLRRSVSGFAVDCGVTVEAVKEAALLDGVTVLLTNTPEEEADAHELLRIWKGQLERERRLADWKGPFQVRSVFLTSQERAQGLLVCHNLALMIYCLLERAARRGLERDGSRKLAGLYAGQHDAIPTGRLIFQAFEYLQLVDLRNGGALVRRLTPLTPLQERLMSLLGVEKPSW